MKKQQNGFTTIEILLVVLIVAVVGFGGYYVWGRQSEKSENKIETPTVQQDQGDTSRQVGSKIELVTGQYIPANVQIKKGETVTWTISDMLNNGQKYGIENNSDSAEKFSSDVLDKSGATFSHKFNEVGTFQWHDKYNASLVGSVKVIE